MLDILFQFFLVIVFICTIIIQFTSKLSEKVKQYDKITLLPYWTFFAPNPMIHDFRILYISRNSDELEIENWEEIELKYTRKWYHFIWNPHKKYSKAVIDMIQSIMIQSQKLDQQQILLTSAYLSLSNFIEHNLIQNGLKFDKSGFQYVIIRDAGYDAQGTFNIVFHSAYHPYS